jgi:TolB-like protein/Tfp pilus assembly protein PilF
MSEPRRAVFLSYASQDAAAARRICDALRAGGVEVWFDQSQLRGGDAWDQEIRGQIRECALFLPIISLNSQSRLEGYFRREWRLAVDRTHDMADGKPFLVPVVIDHINEPEAQVPESFRALQWTQLQGGETPPEFVARIVGLLSRDDARAPAQSRPSSAAVASAVPPIARTPAASRTRLVALAIAAVAILGIGYFVADKFIVSKRAAVAAPPAVAATPERSIAVLPFVNMSSDKEQEYFSDGLAEELLNMLAKTPGLHVIARTSSFSFKGKSDDIPTIARKLNVANILEGSVRKSGNRLRVTTQLIRASDSEQLWSETYDRELKDVFDVQDQIAGAVVAQLRLKLAPARGSAGMRSSNIEAYNQYLLGHESFNRGNAAGYQRAVDAYRRAVALDPGYLAAYCELAVAEYFVADPMADAAGYRRAQAAADKAVELGPEDGRSYAARAFIRTNIGWDWPGALADFTKALELDPSDAWIQYRTGSLLATLGRFPEAVAAARKAIELDPLSSGPRMMLARYLAVIGDMPGAFESIQRALEISPDSIWALEGLGELQMLTGKPTEALATFQKSDIEAFRLLGTVVAEHTLNKPKESQLALDALIAKHAGDSAYQIADAYAWRGERDKAFEWLDRSFAQRDNGLLIIKWDGLITSLRDDPRYAALLRKMHLPE